MSHLTGAARAQYVRRMFGRIAPRYDLLNRLMTMGQDVRWRKEAIKRLALAANTRVLDLGTGTGDLAFEVAKARQDVLVVASDFTPEMIRVGKQRQAAQQVVWVIADAQHLPFAKQVFDGAVSGFLLRNVPDLDKALAEQNRVLSEGGRLVSLDTTPPQPSFIKPLLEFHLTRVIPLLGRLIAGDAEAYTYLPSSTANFLTAEKLQKRMLAAEFEGVEFVRRMLGTVAIHWGRKKLGG
ncbi:MAG: ubiquinone/menaquinone biosynthesis methyltransferase [Anaerolineae bacterium]|nr:ubiquinone/menaquinone biosynthesis methyltransferase [Anaerolineae bacterium]